MMIVLLLLAIIAVILLICVIRTLMVKPEEAWYEGSTDEKRINEYVPKFQKMVQTETVSVRDHPDPEKFRKLHKVIEENFPNVFKNCEKYDIDGNLLVRFKGRNPELDPIILISHLDVVEATGDWTYPPFGAEIHDGKMYGRGTADVKVGVFSFYQAVEELIKEGYTPECDVYLGSSCTEEIGGDGAPKITQWFKDRNIKLFMLSDEGGAMVSDPIPGIKATVAAIGIFEKGYTDVKLTARSKGGHSSTPPKNTPIARLAKMITEIENHNPFKVQFSPAVEGTFESLAPYCNSFGLKLVMCNLWLFKPIVCKIAGKISPIIEAMLQTTIAFTMQKGSDGYNVIPQEAYVTANMRVIPHQNLDESLAVIKDIASRYDVEMELLTGHNASKPLDLNSEPYKMTCETIKKVFPHVGIMPYVVTGGTDSKFFDPVCDHCVRFSPVNYTADQNSKMHGIDENIDINVIPGAVDYYKELIRLQETRK
ncbi:MAG: M20/M25/M40 family metallo-hydrolase [Erysipelotrichaceae bacterium]|nr:M20/M25/M40 family metallo-hydrolase [Erysipelotrichaceae bacterium]